MTNLKITINSDEISPSINRAVEFLKKNKVDYLEIRSIDNKNILDYSLEEIKQVSSILSQNNLKVSAIASPLFKWFIKKPKDDLNFDKFFFNPLLSKAQKKQYIKKAFDIAEILGTTRIRIFSTLLDKNSSFDQFLRDDLFWFALEEAKRRNLFLLLENEPTCLISKKSQLSKFIKKVDSPHLKIWFDVANFYQIGEQVLKKDLLNLRQKIDYFHLKDFIWNSDLTYVPLGEGIINYKRIISDISSVFDKKDIFLSLETHVRQQKTNATKKSLVALRRYINQKRVKYVIIGAGKAAHKHAEAIKTLSNSELRGVYDLNRLKAKKFASKYDVECYPSLNKILKSSETEVVTICTPHNTHIKIAIKAVENNKKVLCEKPFVLSSADLKKHILNNKKAKENIFIVFQNNFRDVIQFLYKVVKRKHLGKILFFSINLRWWRDDNYFQGWRGKKNQNGGILFNQAIHSLEILNRILKLKIRKCRTLTKRYRSCSETEDVLISILELSTGVLGKIEATIYSKYKNIESSILLIGTKGSIKIGGKSLDKLIHFDSLKKIYTPKIEDSSMAPYYLHAKLISTLSSFILKAEKNDGGENNNFQFLTQPKDIINLITFIEKIYSSVY